MQMIASNLPLSATLLATTGSSKLPGTCANVMLSGATPVARSAAIAPSRKRSVTKELNFATMTANLWLPP
jgi:hypothetical protein